MLQLQPFLSPFTLLQGHLKILTVAADDCPSVEQSGWRMLWQSSCAHAPRVSRILIMCRPLVRVLNCWFIVHLAVGWLTYFTQHKCVNRSGPGLPGLHDLLCQIRHINYLMDVVRKQSSSLSEEDVEIHYLETAGKAL